MKFNYKLKSFKKYFSTGFLGLALLSTTQNHAFANVTANLLQHSLIWSEQGNAKAVAFRKSFQLKQKPNSAILNLFADAKYMLWINGKYVARGPCRFDPKRPEYDTRDIAQSLVSGKNTLQVLVYGHVSGGDAMEHTPGLTLSLEIGKNKLTTDPTWKVNTDTRFKAPLVDWDGVRENVRADLESGDWLDPNFNDHQWKNAVLQDGQTWGEFKPRTTPLLSEKEVPYQIQGKTLPFSAEKEETIYLRLKKNIMGYCIFRFEAEAGSVFTVFGHRYTAKAGEQEYITADIFGSGQTGVYAKDWDDNPNAVSIAVTIEKGRFKFKDIRVVNAVAPYVAVGEFESSDALLNRFFKVILNMHTQVTQDTYTDGASEGNEWMADIYNISKFTKVAFAGTHPDGSLNYSDRRHLKKALLDIGISQNQDGRVKAHHPSDRFDLHAYIEDFQALWVMSIRNYYEMTQDQGLVQELYESMKKQMAWFQSKITVNGLFSGREWMVFDNPYAYKTGEGATLNAIIYKAFLDAAYLANLMGDFNSSTQYTLIAAQIKTSFNQLLWNDEKKTINGMLGGKPTTHAAIMALYTGILSPEKVSPVQNFLLHRTQKKITYPLAHLFWFKDLYDMNSDHADQQVLDIIRSKYGNEWNAFNKGYLTAEGCNSGRNFHNFGMVPGVFMSESILGVQTVGAAWDKKIKIEPRLGDLSFARGTVVTENGPVQVSWNKSNQGMKFNFRVPLEVQAEVGIPYHGKIKDLSFNGKILVEKSKVKSSQVRISPRFIYIENVSSGSHEGFLRID